MMLKKNTIKEKQNNFIDEFYCLNSINDQLIHLISFSKKLDHYPISKINDKYLIKNCQSTLWICDHYELEKMFFFGKTDSLIISGFLYMIFSIYNNEHPNDILQSSCSFLYQLGFYDYLTPIRQQGFNIIIQYIFNVALKKLKY